MIDIYGQPNSPGVTAQTVQPTTPLAHTGAPIEAVAGIGLLIAGTGALIITALWFRRGLR